MEKVDAEKRWSNLVFAILFLISLLLFGRIMAPFLMPVLLGGFLVVLFEPVHRLLSRVIAGRCALSAGLSTAAVILLIVVPLALTTVLVGRELLALAEQARALIDDPKFREELAARLPQKLHGFIFTERLHESREVVAAAVSGTASLLRDVLGAGTELAIDVFLMAVSMYYFFLDGRRLYASVARLIPMERRYLDAFAQEFKDVTYAIMYGNTLTAAIQGVVGLAGLYLAEVPHPIVWAVAMMVVALIPIGGTAIVWLPMSIVLMLSGKVPQGLFLLAWGGLLVSTIDNFVRPRLCSARMSLHPLLVFLSMFGGLAVFGMMGLLVGPLIAALFMAMVRIYRRDFLHRTTVAVEKLTHAVRS